MIDIIPRLRPNITRTSIKSVLCTALLLVVASACTQNSSPTLTGGEELFGTLEITISTIGDNQDSDGYTVVIDEGNTEVVEPDAFAEFTVLVGLYSISLMGVSDNCTPAPNPLVLSVTAGQATEGLIVITCI